MSRDETPAEPTLEEITPQFMDAREALCASSRSSTWRPTDETETAETNR